MFPRLSLDMLPQTSLFRSGEPFYLLAIPFLVGIPETMVMLHLIWRSIGLRIPVRHSIGASVIAGLVAFLVRQVIPVPFHILPNLALLMICAMIVGRINFAHALLGSVFAFSVTIIGSFLTIEPLLLFVKNLIHGPIGFTIASLVETIIPLLVLVLFARLNLNLLPRGKDKVDCHAKKTI